MRRGFNKLAILPAAAILAGNIAPAANSNETPKTINSGSPVENTNSYLQLQTRELGALILRNRVELQKDYPRQGVDMAVVRKTSVVGVKSATMMAIMREKNGQPDPMSTEVVEIDSSLRGSYVGPDGDYRLVVSKEIDLFGQDHIWRAEQCAHPTDGHHLARCYSTDPKGPGEIKMDPYTIMADVSGQAQEEVLLPSQHPLKKK